MQDYFRLILFCCLHLNGKTGKKHIAPLPHTHTLVTMFLLNIIVNVKKIIFILSLIIP